MYIKVKNKSKMSLLGMLEDTVITLLNIGLIFLPAIILYKINTEYLSKNREIDDIDDSICDDDNNCENNIEEMTIIKDDNSSDSSDSDDSDDEQIKQEKDLIFEKEMEDKIKQILNDF